MMVMDCEGVDDKPLRDCTDEDVRLIVASYANRGSMKLFDDEWFLRTTLEARERERNPLADAGLIPLLGLGWSRLLLGAARRNSLVRLHSAYVAGLTIAFNDGERRRRRRRARAQLIDAQAGAFIETSAGRTDSQTKGVSVSTQEQGGAQGQDSPMEPDSPQEPTPGEPGTMPEEPRTAPDAPTMPEEPDLAPPESPEESGDS
jgi:hypothetical protein